MQSESLYIDLSDIDLEDVEVLAQEGSRAIPDFAASSCDICAGGTCSCTVICLASITLSGRRQLKWPVG